MSEEMIVEETVPGHFIVYTPSAVSASGSRVHRRVRPLATIERRCGRWLWWMRDGSDIGLCSSLEAARAAVRSRMG